MPPSRQAIERVQVASERMRQAHNDHLAFIERPDRTFSLDERAENERLLTALRQSIEEYWDAFSAAVAEDLAARQG